MLQLLLPLQRPVLRRVAPIEIPAHCQWVPWQLNGNRKQYPQLSRPIKNIDESTRSTRDEEDGEFERGDEKGQRPATFVNDWLDQRQVPPSRLQWLLRKKQILRVMPGRDSSGTCPSSLQGYLTSPLYHLSTSNSGQLNPTQTSKWRFRNEYGSSRV